MAVHDLTTCPVCAPIVARAAYKRGRLHASITTGTATTTFTSPPSPPVDHEGGR